MIKKIVIAQRERTVVEFEKDIFISTFNKLAGLKVLVTLSDKTEDFKGDNGKLDLDKDYDMKDQTIKSIDPEIILEFNDPKSIRNMIEILKDAEELLKYKLPKTRDRG
jgi:hypothetical protein